MSAPFTIYQPQGEQPATPKQVPHKGGAANPSAAAIATQFPGAVVRSHVMWGETTVFVEKARLHDVVQWLRDDPAQCYEYLSDVTAVEYRDFMQPMEVVWHLRSIKYRRFLRLKVELIKTEPLEVPSVIDVYQGADWLERETFDMFGIKFAGHPDLRRILLWESFQEGYPLRKDFPLRGRLSRSQQLTNALSANPEARYSMEELSIADAFEELPLDMRARIAGPERTGE